MIERLYGADFSNGFTLEQRSSAVLANPPYAYMVVDSYGDVVHSGFAAHKQTVLNAVKQRIRFDIPADRPPPTPVSGRPVSNAVQHELKAYMQKHGHSSISEMRSTLRKARKDYLASCTIEIVETYPLDKNGA